MLRHRAAAAAWSLYLICGQDALSAPPAAVPAIDADSVQLVGVTLMPVAGRPHISVGVGNRTDRILWLRITLDAGKPVLCEGERVPLAAMKIGWFMCPVDPVIEGRIYPVRIDIYREQWDQASAAQKQARPVFSIRDVQWLQSQLKR